LHLEFWKTAKPAAHEVIELDQILFCQEKTLSVFKIDARGQTNPPNV
jgi:hypothetical protein